MSIWLECDRRDWARGSMETKDGDQTRGRDAGDVERPRASCSTMTGAAGQTLGHWHGEGVVVVGKRAGGRCLSLVGGAGGDVGTRWASCRTMTGTARGTRRYLSIVGSGSSLPVHVLLQVTDVLSLFTGHNHRRPLHVMLTQHPCSQPCPLLRALASNHGQNHHQGRCLEGKTYALCLLAAVLTFFVEHRG